MHIYDSVQKTKLPFEPIKEGEASIYVCGPTVYDDAHLGHARSSLAFDLLSRTLKAENYKVTMGKNFTDIDDKIIKKVEETGKSMSEITSFYIDRYVEEMAALGVQRADIEPKATESLQAIENMIQKLIDKDIAYVISTGDVYFDTSKDAHYGDISHQVGEDDDNQSRVEHTTEKRNPKDFALWKACKGSDDICFDTAFSSGRPGWHIECSAMIEKHFTGSDEYSIDIHGGGADLLFPHHENEAAQSRCTTGHELAKYWMHNGFVQIDGEKMSKSLGNSFFLKDALKVYDGEVLRYYLNSVHYRNDFNFNEEDLLNAKKRLDKLYRLKKRVSPGKGSAVNKEFKNALLSAMSDDLNISTALAVIDEMIANTNDSFDKEAKNKPLKGSASKPLNGASYKALKKETLANIEFIDTLLGFGGQEPFTYFQIGISEEEKAKIETLITQRSEAKKEKNFERSDAIRDELISMGISIMDTPDGTVWEKS
jgi:cysteinyl-tRNA synthetase